MNVNYNKQELRALKDNYFKSKALYETVRDTAKKIQKNILTEHPFYEDEEKTTIFESKGRGSRDTRILNPFDSYLMNESDFNKYLDLCYEEYKKSGIDDARGREYIPEAESRDLYKEAEKRLVAFGIEIIPNYMPEKQKLKKAVKMVKYRDKVLNLVLSLEC